MSELSRRNTLQLPHLRSAYPIESQFVRDDSITEDRIRSGLVKARPNDLYQRSMADVNSPVASPVTRLSQVTSSLSLESPTSLRSGRSRGGSQDSVEAKIPPPAPVVLRRSSRTPSNGKKPCTSDHGIRKRECEAEHKKVDFQDVEKENQEVLSPSKAKKRTVAERKSYIDQELDSSQESSSSSFLRDSLRGSKRSKVAGNISYTRPGPPTPSRGMNKSSVSASNISQTGSLDSQLANLTASNRNSVHIPNTPEMSRVTRSSTTLKTPLLDTTNTPEKKPSTSSKMSRITPIAMKKLSSAFRNKTYKLMKKQDQNIDRDQIKSRTAPLKAKDKVVPSPRKKLRK